MIAPISLNEQFAELRDALRQYGRSRFPALRSDLDDLVSQSLADLWAYLNRRSDASRDDTDSTTIEIEPTALRAVAFSIFKRRAADAFREPARRWALTSLTTDAESISEQSSTETDRAVFYRQMLQVCIAELAAAPEEDRALFALVTAGGPTIKSAMNARGRQRLHRLRNRLAAAIRRELGEEVATVLRSDASRVT